MDYTKMDRQEQNRILRQHGYRWEKNYEYDFDHYEEPDGTFVWELYSSDGREVTVARAFAEIERGVDVVAEEVRLAQEAEKVAEQLRRDLAEWKSRLAEQIRREGERPEGDHVPEGEHVLDSSNIYGGGDWFVIGADWIWHVRNNGMDGDDWSQNNVRTGGAGAIGWRIPFDAQIAECLGILEQGKLPAGMPWNAYWN